MSITPIRRGRPRITAEQVEDTWGRPEEGEVGPFGKLRTPASDSQGHRTEIRVNVPLFVAAAIEDIVKKAAIPGVRNPASFVRLCIQEGIHYLSEAHMDPKMREQLVGPAARLETLSLIARHQELEAEATTLKTNLTALSDAFRENRPSFRRICQEVKENVATMQEPYRTKVLDEIERLWR